uniref:Pyridoxal phosphate homeostasis protein n=1 Tax=Thermodesulfobacterium geofontis TaxID=1295609 RepID=A0A7V5XGU5_9BACT
MDLENKLRENYFRILEKIQKTCEKSGRKLEEIKILGASKKQSPEKIKIVFKLGIKIFGENYVQEAEKKILELEDLPIEWHFIGRLQTNKVKKALNLFSMIQTLDRISLAQEIQKQAEKKELTVPVLIEVNIGKEPTKGGIYPENLEEFIEEVKKFDRIKIKGLMCLPPYEENLEKIRPYFIKMQKIFEKIKIYMDSEFNELSMGTSIDYTVAIEEGATIIRIGEALFGKRN